jgi:hypothetical protein
VGSKNLGEIKDEVYNPATSGGVGATVSAAAARVSNAIPVSQEDVRAQLEEAKATIARLKVSALDRCAHPDCPCRWSLCPNYRSTVSDQLPCGLLLVLNTSAASLRLAIAEAKVVHKAWFQASREKLREAQWQRLHEADGSYEASLNR